MMSDILFILFMPIVTLNVLVAFIVLIKNIFEKIFSAARLSKLLKGFVIYIILALPVIVAYIGYRFLYVKKINITGEDIFEFYYVKEKTLSNSTDMGSSSVFTVFIILWFIGILVLGIIRAFRENIFLKQLEKLSEAVSESEDINMKDKLIRELGIKKNVELFTNSMIPSPFIVGFIRPKIFIPENNFSKPEKEFMLKHELVHLLNNDYIYRKLMFFLCIIYWFNPAVYILSDKFVEINEMACDERVLDGYKKRERLVYMKLLCRMAGEK